MLIKVALKVFDKVNEGFEPANITVCEVSDLSSENWKRTTAIKEWKNLTFRKVLTGFAFTMGLWWTTPPTCRTTFIFCSFWAFCRVPIFQKKFRPTTTILSKFACKYFIQSKPDFVNFWICYVSLLHRNSFKVCW